MAGEEEEIEVVASMRDELSRPARTAAQSIDELGDEAQETAVQLEMMDAAADDAADSMDDLAASSRRAAAAQAQSERAMRQNRDEMGRFVADSDKVTRSNKKMTGSFNGLFRMMKKFGVVSKVITGVKWVSIAFGVSFLSRALIGLGAAGYAAVAGLTPLTGMLITYPAAIFGVVQAMAAMKLATHGVGEAISVLANPQATAEEVAEAVKNLTENQISFASAVADSADEWKQVRKNVGDRFFEDMDDTYRRLSENYLPIVDKYLTETADSMSDVVKYNAAWLNSASGQKVIRDVMADNAENTRRWGLALSDGGRIVLTLVRAAGPMLEDLSTDARNLFQRWAIGVEENEGRISGFFDRSYSLFKRTVGSLGDYIVALYNIGKEADVLSDYMGTGLEDLGQDFRKWTESDTGKQQIRDFFEDAVPVVRELAYWTRDLAKAGSEIALGEGDFVSSSRALREEVLPNIVDFWEGVSDRVVPAARKINEIYEDLDEGGVTGGLGRALGWVADGIGSIANALANAPDFVKEAAGIATGLAALYGIGKKVTGGKIGQVLGMAGVQKVFVVNMPGAGLGGVPGVPGVPGGKPGGVPIGTVPAGVPLLPGLGSDEHKRTPLEVPDEYKYLLEKGKTMGPIIDENSQKIVKGTTIVKDYGAAVTGADKHLQNMARAGLPLAAQKFQKLGDNVRDVPKKSNTDITLGGYKESLTGLENVKRKANEIPSSKTIDIFVNASVSITKKIKTALDDVAGMIDDALYTGGSTHGGNYLFGELGTEAFVSPTGGIRLIGMNGPQIGRLGTGAVIPASGTADPWGGDMGNAPAWAVDAFRRASQPQGATGVPQPRQSGQTPREVSVTIGPIYPQAEFDIESAVRRGVTQAMNEQEERS